VKTPKSLWASIKPKKRKNLWNSSAGLFYLALTASLVILKRKAKKRMGTKVTPQQR